MMTRSLLLLIVSLFLFAGCTGSDKQPPASKNQITTDSSIAVSLIDSAMNYVLKPGSEKTDIDSALMLLKQTEFINLKLHSTFIAGQIDFAYSNAYREGRDEARGRIYIAKALKLLKAAGNHAALGQAYMESSNYYSIYFSGQDEDKKNCYYQAWLEFQQTNLKERQAEALKNLADMEHLMGRYVQGIEHLKQALIIYRSIGNKNLQGVYDLLNESYQIIGDDTTALKYGLMALRTAEEVNDTTMQLCAIYNRLAKSYHAVNKIPEFYFYIKKSLEVAIRCKDDRAALAVTGNYVRELINQGKANEGLIRTREVAAKIGIENALDSCSLAMIYALALINLNRTSEADIYAQKIAKFYDRSIPLGEIYYYNFFTKYNFVARRFQLVRDYATKGIAFSKANKLGPNNYVNLYSFLSRADSGLGNFRSALNNYHEYKNLTDSMMNKNKKYQVEQLQVSFESEKKDRDLKINQQNIELLTNKSRSQDDDLKRSNSIRNITIVTSIFFIALLFIGYRIKQRHNEKLQSQQQEINHQNELLKMSLSKQQKLTEDKEWLIKEIHHRVKNNLQIVISLFNAQTEFLSDPSALQAIQESRERMHAIALIHQKLYEPGAEGGLIDMRSYIQEMTNYFSGNMTNERIQFHISVQNTILDVSQAVPVGLILNEVITNSIKYAFPTGQNGVINIVLKEINNEVVLTIADNGIGLPAKFSMAQQTSLGIQLIKLFSDQLEGDLHVSSENGVKVTLTFKKQMLPDVLSIDLNSTV